MTPRRPHAPLLFRFSILAIAALAPLAAHAQGALTAHDASDSESGSVAAEDLVLERESLHIALDDQHATTTLDQTFLNRAAGRLEGTYRLRAGDGAIVEGFAYWNGEQKIVGEVFEKQAAREVYEEVTHIQRDPALLEKDGEGSFSFRVFPIEPGEHKRVQVCYGEYLPRTTSTGRIVEYRARLERPDAAIEIELHDGRGVKSLTSTTHALDVKDLGGGRLRAVASRGDESSAELILRYEIEEKPLTVSTVIHRDPGQDAYIAVRMTVPSGQAAGPVRDKDVTIVIDRSGSMSGEPIQQARAAARAVVERLRPTDRVNVIAFDHGVDSLFAAPRTVDDATRSDALAFIDRISAGGGTDIAQALKTALAAQTKDGAPHVVLFLTDGQSSSQEALAAARNDRGDARVFTVGLGAGVEKPLLSRLAATKRGRFTFIATADAIRDQVTHLFAQIESPVLTNLCVETTGLSMTSIYPRTLADLSPGDEIFLTGRVIRTGKASDIEVSLHGELGGNETVFSTTTRVPEKASHAWVGRRWAQARIDDLLEEIALEGEKDELKNEVIELAVAYELVTPYTSFLAIPESELTGAAKQSMQEMRVAKQKAMAKHADAVALSRDAMPPGDPVLSVVAPRDAKQVTAYFPFGLVKDLAWDDHGERWTVRFLVPKTVSDGKYVAKVVIVHADGHSETASASYTIDSAEPDFEVDYEAMSGGVFLSVRANERVREARVAVVGDARRRVALAAVTDGDPDGTPGADNAFDGFIALAPGTHQLRIVVADEARNEADQIITVTVK